jgi:hypothetical protein
MDDFEKEYTREITDLKARIKTAECNIEGIIKEQKEHRKLLQEAELKDEKMSSDINTIKNMLEDLLKKKIRTIDVIIALAVLFTSAMSVLTAAQSNELTKIIIEISKQALNN